MEEGKQLKKIKGFSSKKKHGMMGLIEVVYFGFVLISQEYHMSIRSITVKKAVD